MNTMHEHLKRLLFGTALIIVLVLSFLAYLRPAFVFDLANRVLLCF